MYPKHLATGYDALDKTWLNACSKANCLSNVTQEVLDGGNHSLLGGQDQVVIYHRTPPALRPSADCISAGSISLSTRVNRSEVMIILGWRTSVMLPSRTTHDGRVSLRCTVAVTVTALCAAVLDTDCSGNLGTIKPGEAGKGL